MLRAFAKKTLSHAPGLLLFLSLFIAVFFSASVAIKNLYESKRNEFHLHTERVAEALKAQIFERYADSQAFALNPALKQALLNPTKSNREAAQGVLQQLLNLYQVYKMSALTDHQGKVIALAYRDRADLTSKDTSAIGETTHPWQRQKPESYTIVTDFSHQPDLKLGNPSEKLQRFSSPVHSNSESLIGVITNYADSYYLEREMNLAFSYFTQLRLPPVLIHVLSEGGEPIFKFSSSENISSLLKSSVLKSQRKDFVIGPNLISLKSIADTRVNSSVRWLLALETNHDLFFRDYYWLRNMTYGFLFLILLGIAYGALVINRAQIKYEKELSRKLIHAQNEERTRLSREIHDDLGQNLTATKIHLSQAAQKDPFIAIQEAQQMLNHTIESMRRISHQLHPSLLENLGLKEAIEWKASSIFKNTGIEYSIEFNDTEEILSSLSLEDRDHIFRIIQECFSNILKHSKSKNVFLVFSKEKHFLHLCIKDDGIGLPAKLSKHTLGMTSIMERAKIMQGSATFNSGPKQGTQVEITIPLHRSLKNDSDKNISH